MTKRQDRARDRARAGTRRTKPQSPAEDREWYDGGALKSFVDHTNGVADGVSVTWDESGQLRERTE